MQNSKQISTKTYRGGTLFDQLLQYKRDRMQKDKKFRNDEIAARKRRAEERANKNSKPNPTPEI